MPRGDSVREVQGFGLGGGIGQTLRKAEQKPPVGFAQHTLQANPGLLPIRSGLFKHLSSTRSEAVEPPVVFAGVDADKARLTGGGEAPREGLDRGGKLGGKIAVRDFSGFGDGAQDHELRGLQSGRDEDLVVEMGHGASYSPGPGARAGSGLRQYRHMGLKCRSG